MTQFLEYPYLLLCKNFWTGVCVTFVTELQTSCKVNYRGEKTVHQAQSLHSIKHPQHKLPPKELVGAYGGNMYEHEHEVVFDKNISKDEKKEKGGLASIYKNLKAFLSLGDSAIYTSLDENHVAVKEETNMVTASSERFQQSWPEERSADDKQESFRLPVTPQKKPNSKRTVKHSYYKGNFSIIILPDNPWKSKWDLLIGMMIIYSGIVIPLRICFEMEVELWTANPTFILDIIIDASFVLDIIASFNTAFTIDDQDGLPVVVTDRISICMNYLKSWFIIDIGSVLPFDYIIPSPDVRALKLLRMLRLVRLLRLLKIFKLSKLVERLDPDADVDPLYVSLTGTIVKTVGMAHIMACFWFFIGASQENDKSANWVDYFEIRNSNENFQYVTSLYWTVATMLAVGYGDVYAVNTQERVYAIATELFGAVMFGAVIGTISVLVAGADLTRKATKSTTDDLKSYLTERNVPKPLQQEAKAAIRYYLKNRSPFDEVETLTTLPFNIRNELIRILYADAISSVKILQELSKSKDSMAEVFVAEIIMFMKPARMQPGEIILEEGDLCDEISFITKGFVEFTRKFSNSHDNVCVGSASTDDYFGEFEYQKRGARIFTTTASVLVTLCCIPALEFRRISSKYPSVKRVIDQQFSIRERNAELVLNRDNKVVRTDKGFFESELQIENGALTKSPYSKNRSDLEEVPVAKSSNFRMIEAVEATVEATSNELWRQESITMLSKKWIIDPDWWEKRNWDVFIGILIVWSVIYIPYKMGFNVVESPGMAAFALTIDVLFTIDLFLSFRVAYKHPKTDELVIDGVMITKQYLQTWFIIDFLSVMPFEHIMVALFSGGGTSTAGGATKLLKIIRLIRLIKLVRLLKLSQYMDKVEDELSIQPAVFNLVTLMMRVMFIAHFSACFFALISRQEASENENVTWMEDDIKWSEKTNMEQYIGALYWAITTMTTVGYGDIIPDSEAVSTKIFVIVMMVVGATVFGYLLANVGTALESMRTPQNIFLANMKKYFESKNVPVHHSINARRHWAYVQSQTFDRTYVIDYLPSRLMRQILFIAHKDTIQRITFFNHISNHGIVLTIFRHMRPAAFQEGVYLCRKNYSLDETFCIISGVVDIIDVMPDSTREYFLCEAVEGDIVGKEGFIFQKFLHADLHMCSARARTKSETYLLDEKVMQELISLNSFIAIHFQTALAKALAAQRKRIFQRFQQRGAESLKQLNFNLKEPSSMEGMDKRDGDVDLVEAYVPIPANRYDMAEQGRTLNSNLVAYECYRRDGTYNPYASSVKLSRCLSCPVLSGLTAENLQILRRTHSLTYLSSKYL